MWFGLCYYFGRRGREGWRDLTKSSFTLKVDEENHEFLAENTTMRTKNHQGGPKAEENDYSDPRIYDVTFLQGYKAYVGKLHESCDSFFQTPRADWSRKDNCWYKNMPLGQHTIHNLMAKISKGANLSQTYTPHCVRASMISILFKSGVQPKEICQITKHKNENSLNSYINGKILGEALNKQVKNAKNA